MSRWALGPDPGERRGLLEIGLQAEWDEAVAEKRRVAEVHGITEKTIDRAIHRRRYGE